MVFSKKNKFFLFGLLFFLFFSSVYAEYNRYGIPDSSEIRQSLEQTWFYAPLSNVRMNKAEIRTNRIGEKFQVRLEETEKDFAILFNFSDNDFGGNFEKAAQFYCDRYNSN